MKWTMRWGSHLPILDKVINHTTGNVLELGMGIYSTPYLFWMCLAKNRTLTSYDNNVKYYSMVGKTNNPQHKSYLIEDWDSLELTEQWDVAFIDVDPIPKRAELAKKLMFNARFVILHDTQERDEKYYNYSSIYPLFVYRYDYKKFMPNTSVLSNFERLDFLNGLQ
jgi:hypothetical protein